MKVLITAVASLVCACGASGQVQFTWCGSPPDGEWLTVTGVADGGAAIAGSGLFPGPQGGTITRGYRWTPATGVVEIGALPTSIPGPYSEGNGISADGAVVVGYGHSTAIRAVRWTEATGLAELALLPGGVESVAAGVSADGQTIVGWCSAAGGRSAGSLDEDGH